MATTANGLAGLSLQNAQQNTDRNLQAQQTNASNSLNAQQFNATAQQQAATANQQAGLQGATLNLNAAQQLGQQGQYALNMLGQLGNTQQQINQQYAQAPLAHAQATSQMYGQMPYGLYAGSTTNQSGTTRESGLSVGLDDGGKLAMFAASDPRAKHEISWAGRDPLGRNVYDYNYLDDPEDTPARRGLMADETFLTDPDAVGIRPDGLAAINYDRINRKTAAALGDGLGGPEPEFDPQQRPGAVGLPLPGEAASRPRHPKPFSDPSVFTKGWRPEWIGANRPKPFSDPSVLMDNWAPEWRAGNRPKPFSDPSVLMSGWRPQRPKLSALDAIDDPSEMVDALQPAQVPQSRPFTPAGSSQLGSMLLDMLRKNQGGLIGGSFPWRRG